MTLHTWDAGAFSKVAYLDGKNADTNAGGGWQIGEIYLSGAKIYAFRPLLEYDLRGLLPGTSIVSAILTVTKIAGLNGSGGWAGTVYRLTQPAWTQAGATWNKYDGTNNWATAGGDYSTPSVAFTSPLSGATSYTFPDIKTIVQDAIDNRSGWLELLCRPDNESPGSSESFGADLTTVGGPRAITLALEYLTAERSWGRAVLRGAARGM